MPCLEETLHSGLTIWRCFLTSSEAQRVFQMHGKAALSTLYTKQGHHIPTFRKSFGPPNLCPRGTVKYIKQEIDQPDIRPGRTGGETSREESGEARGETSREESGEAGGEMSREESGGGRREASREESGGARGETSREKSGGARGETSREESGGAGGETNEVGQEPELLAEEHDELTALVEYANRSSHVPRGTWLSQVGTHISGTWGYWWA
ncbi:hypothetical protein NDU88_005445 [Pleurodeles waltl]|uniref:Uncharacterized protein n=1 Tax=Pleurodeles waltl TaxID=8319 RepID=A0AAV7VNJ1_PLEWA|nr:hypothetical protein NDU88_005445 [Pleurodeles waltl]